MTTSSVLIREGCLRAGLLLNEPIGGELVRAGGDGTWTVCLVGTQSETQRPSPCTRPACRARHGVGR